MKRICQYLLAFGVTMLLVASCSRGRVIPRGDMAEIYAEMFLVDQWLKNDRAASRIADTSQVYVPIFEKYGYTVEDYWASVSYYLQDPDRFSRILNRSNQQLESQLKALQAEMESAVPNTDETSVDQKDTLKKRERLSFLSCRISCKTSRPLPSR